MSRSHSTKATYVCYLSSHHRLSLMVSVMCPQCDRRCKSLGGLKRHQNSIHRDDPRLAIPVTELQRFYHPNLSGTYEILNITLFSLSVGQRCDKRGVFVPPNIPPEVPIVKPGDDWSPFTSRAGFELAEFMFTEAELSQKKIDKLLELWAATLVPHGDSPPITNHRNLHQQIDEIELGTVEWENARLRYKGPLPQTTRPPEWKTAEYDVWYRNPREVIKSILASPDLDGHVDYVAYQEFNAEQRQYGNFMSGDWSWRQSVRFNPPYILAGFVTLFHRTSLHRTLQPMVPCSFQSSLGPTKRQSLSPLARMNFTPYTFQSAMFKITSAVHTRMLWY